MHSVLAAEGAVLVELETVGIVLLVLESVVVTLLALGAGQADLYTHFCFPPKGKASKTSPVLGRLIKLSQQKKDVNEKFRI